MPSRPPKPDPAASIPSTRKKRAPRRLPDGDIPADDLHAVFGRNLKIARLSQSLTLEDVANRAGATFQYLSKVERGHGNLTLATAGRLAAAVGRSVRELLDPPASGKPA